MVDNVQHRLKRVRPPRVQITYDVETGDATERKELPFVVGILSDLSGDNRNKPILKERSFTDVRAENIDGYMNSVKPKLNLDVEDKLSGDEDKRLKVDLEFNQLDDFTPMGLVAQIPSLWKLYQARVQLKDLQGKLEGNDRLNDLLAELHQDKDSSAALKAVLSSTEDKK